MEVITRIKNQATRIYFPLIDAADGRTFFTGTVWGDLTSEAIQAVYDDGSADQALSITGTPTESGTITGYWYLDLTAPQMNHDIIVIKFNADEIDEQSILITTTVRTLLGTLATEANVNSKHSTTDSNVNSKHTTTDSNVNSKHTTTDSNVNSKHNTTDGNVNSKHSTTDGNVNSNHSTTDGLINAIGAIVTAIELQTDKMNFTGDDIKCTLDGEKVSVSAMDASVITTIVTGVFAKVVDNTRTFLEVAKLLNGVFRGSWSYNTTSKLLTVTNEDGTTTVWNFSTTNQRTTS